MDRSQHQRYLVYLKKFDYFGRGRARLSAAEFQALEAELDALEASDDGDRERRRDLRAALLRD